jgi:hypothetical protein
MSREIRFPWLFAVQCIQKRREHRCSFIYSCCCSIHLLKVRDYVTQDKSRGHGSRITVSRCHGVTVSWCHGVMVSWCHGVTVSWCHGVMVSRCHGVTVSRIYKLILSLFLYEWKDTVLGHPKLTFWDLADYAKFKTSNICLSAQFYEFWYVGDQS